MAKEMVQGQFYRVGMTGRTETETTTIDCLVIATSVDDCRMRFPYLFDVSDFLFYRIDFIVKEPVKVYVVRSKVERSAPSSPDAVIERDAGSESIWQRVGITDSKKWEVHAKTTCFAKDQQHAVKKLSERLLGGSERVVCVAEEVSGASGFAKAKDMSVFPKATFVRG
ncbi:MAG: hypothetical protein DI563_02095 [Variovorax paradoxus]|uniref:Uncharacterized protein n=1 Tax=Variovorax paradoxus TaxID=34073 RepID=A0A2W5QHF0_VARPD|nr:MAG: hypothetical protein DI563_02095 [Variovorax paradoxus]